MSYDHTIALARALMADGHFDAVEQLVGPLLGRDDADESDEAVLRCILAGSGLLLAANFERANALLAGYAVAGEALSLPEAVRTEVNVWRGWALANGGTTVSQRRAGLALLSEAVDSSTRLYNTALLVWALAGYVKALDETGASDLAKIYEQRLYVVADALSIEAVRPVASRSAGSGFSAAAVHPANSTISRKTANTTLASDFDRLESAVVAGLSVLIMGEPGVGKSALARELATASASQLIEVSASEFDTAEQFLRGAVAEDAPISVVVYDADQLDVDHQQRLLEVLSATSPDRLHLLVSTASRDPLQLAKLGMWSPELSLELSSTRIEIPPLRERREDVEVIVRSHLSRRLPGEPTAAITDEALDALRQAEWPENDKELIALIDSLRRSLAVDPSPVIDIGHLPRDLTTKQTPLSTLHRWVNEEFSRNRDLEAVLSHAERLLIESTLAETGGQVSAAAELLGLTRQGLYKKMKRLDVDPARFHGSEEQSQHANELVKEYEGID
ncbi:MAG: AAA family ATPase [Rhodothermia bacterium]|nr:AAA family ATPase [Rhodothermia bacterium]